ncbi:MAG TPA: glycosyltransferase family 2 protein [Blastocatellia bacterium]|nr:glycosyltransferase family 2 protein [Blastocatellia bacterium]
MKITATIITLNEEINIKAAIESLTFADEIVVVDSGSTDRTVELARENTDQVFVNSWPGYAAQKNFAADRASNDWIFNLDADERVSPELAREIQSVKDGPDPSAQAFEMPRLCFYLGRWIKHSGWRPDYKTRLYDRRVASWKGDFVHESVNVQGRTGRLGGDLLHYTARSASEHHLRMDRYTTLAAQEALSQGKTTSVLSIIFSPLTAFIRSYVFRLGFLDGAPGLAIAYFAAHYVFLKEIKIWESHNG